MIKKEATETTAAATEENKNDCSLILLPCWTIYFMHLPSCLQLLQRQCFGCNDVRNVCSSAVVEPGTQTIVCLLSLVERKSSKE